MLRIQSLNLFLEDGNPFGRIKCTVPYWTGTAYKIPREKFEPRSEYKLCFFFSDTGKPCAHIGQGAPDWSEAVVFADKSLEPKDINFLECKFSELARAANRYEITNTKNFTRPNISAEKESELEIFAEYVRIIVGILGYKIFEPVAEVPAPPDENSTEGEIFYISRQLKTENRSINARCRRIGSNFIILAGSEISKTTAKYISDKVKKARKRAKISADNILLEDFILDTPSSAAEFVLGVSLNGWAEWKTKDGTPLRDFR